MEALRLRTTPGIAKVIGMLFCIAGVANLAFVKGPHFKITWHNNPHPFGHHDAQQHHHVGSTTNNTWIKGCFLMLLSNTFWGFWLVLQVTFSIHIARTRVLFVTRGQVGPQYMEHRLMDGPQI